TVSIAVHKRRQVVTRRGRYAPWITAWAQFVLGGSPVGGRRVVPMRPGISSTCIPVDRCAHVRYCRPPQSGVCTAGTPSLAGGPRADRTPCGTKRPPTGAGDDEVAVSFAF